MFLTTWHMVFATVITQCMSKTTEMLPGVKEVCQIDFIIVSIVNILISFKGKVNMTVVRNQLLPVSIFFAISLVCGNTAYIYLSVSYIQVVIVFENYNLIFVF